MSAGRKGLARRGNSRDIIQKAFGYGEKGNLHRLFIRRLRDSAIVTGVQHADNGRSSLRSIAGLAGRHSRLGQDAAGAGNAGSGVGRPIVRDSWYERSSDLRLRHGCDSAPRHGRRRQSDGVLVVIGWQAQRESGGSSQLDTWRRNSARNDFPFAFSFCSNRSVQSQSIQAQDSVPFLSRHCRRSCAS